MNNSEFCTRWVLEAGRGGDLRVLDYGCGAGELVSRLREQGAAAFGCDIFYEGGDSSALVDPTLFGTVIRKMEGNSIPFDDDSFDVVINVQVMEHVEDLDTVLSEIHRVLKPGGAVLSLFPDTHTWREGHCGVPFLHWFQKRSRARVYYGAAFHLAGLGHFRENKSAVQWSSDFCRWLDDWTHYRSRNEIRSTYAKYFTGIHHLEDHWLKQRLGGRQPLALRMPGWVQRLLVTKLAGLVFLARKPPA